MDFEKYSLEEIFLAALRSETDSKKVYVELGKAVKNQYLKDKILFLADEEEKHFNAISDLFRKQFPKKKPKVPARSPVPLPELKAPEEGTPLSVVIESAMKAEEAAKEFYEAFAGRFPPRSDEHKLLLYFSNMELGHYKLLENEKHMMFRDEYFDTEWPMMHAGP